MYSFWFFLVWAVGLSVFCLVVFACSFDLFFGCVLLLFLSVLFLVSFRFAFPCLYLSCLLLIVLYRLVSVPEYDSKKRGGTQVQIVSRTDRLLVRYRFNCCMEWEWAVPEESDE